MIYLSDNENINLLAHMRDFIHPLSDAAKPFECSSPRKRSKDPLITAAGPKLGARGSAIMQGRQQGRRSAPPATARGFDSRQLIEAVTFSLACRVSVLALRCLFITLSI